MAGVSSAIFIDSYVHFKFESNLKEESGIFSLLTAKYMLV